MSVKSFKFVSPGVFINEIDNSFIPKSPQAIGPVVIGRARRGLAMQPVTVESYSDFVEMFGDTVPGFGGGDISRYGNLQSPMYGTYAAKAFLRPGVAPLTYIRLLGQQTTQGSAVGGDAGAGWKTLKTPSPVPASNGGAYGLWLFTSSSNKTQADLGTGSLAAVWYLSQGDIYLSGTTYGGSVPLNGTGTGTSILDATGSNNVIIGTDSDNLFTMVISGGIGQSDKIRFGFDDSKGTFVRKVFNTNPQLVSSSTFYASTTETAKSYWLGETYEQELRDRGFTSGCLGTMMAISKGTSTGPWTMASQASIEAAAGWFIGQDLGQPASYVPFRQQKLFRLVGRGHGEWLHKNCKVSIANIRGSSTTITEYGTFSIIIRNLNDTDSNVQVMERYDNLSLDPTSPKYVARVIGDKYGKWDANDKRLKTYGEYDNNSKFVYVEMNSDVDAGATDPTLLPFGYFGPPRFRAIYDLQGSGSANASTARVLGADVLTLSNTFLTGGIGIPNSMPSPQDSKCVVYLSAGFGVAAAGMDAAVGGPGSCTASLAFPTVRLRLSASDGGLSDPTLAYWGMQTTRTATSTVPDASIADYHKALYSGYATTTAGGGGANPTNPFATTGVEDYAYVFSLDNIASGSAGGIYYYQSGSRATSTSITSGAYTELLNAGYDKFTAPFYGGFDGFNINKPDPLYNNGMGTTATEDNSYEYHTYKRAIDTVSDPEFLDMNLLSIPGLTNDSLTTHAIRVCEDRADSLAVIDLPNVYIPSHETYKASKPNRIGTTPVAAANSLRDRIIDSSYGCTFYPWVQTRDENTGRLLWIPPSVAMMGVLASSEAAAELWFAPAGFNRGGLSEGAAGIPVTGVSQRLTSKERDTLYESNINPIASFPSSGIVVFGQKTLQERQSALDRINVRRLVIFLKKQISILSTKILFEQNVQATWNRFISMVEPFLANVKTRFGITDYKLILDESTTTPDLIDQNILYAKIMIKPARAIEYIAIDFVIMSTGASFED